MEVLNINNYEAYYLDFLEGNLNEEDTAVLLDFLDKHPDLKLEEEIFVSLENNSVTLDNSYKQSLKQVLFEEDLISRWNINSFLIAQTEGQLSPRKEEELEKFIALNPIYLKEQKLFQASHLTANLGEIYTEKSSLKQARVFPLRAFFAMTVAASIALFIYLGDFSNDPISVAANDKKSVEQKKPIHTGVPKGTIPRDKMKTQGHIHTINPVIIESKRSFIASVDIKEVNSTLQKKHQESRKENVKVAPLSSIKIKHFELNEEFLEPELAAIYVLPNSFKYKERESEYTTLGFNQMNNPIMPITYKLSTLMKKDIDFRTAKPTSKHSGGFYFKIGKFVISRSKSY